MWSATYMTKNMNKKWEDDGRVVADMSQVRVSPIDLIAPEGLRERLMSRRPRDKHASCSPTGAMQPPLVAPVELTEGELRALMKASLKAAFLLAGIFIAAGGVLILFCVFIWFK